MNQDEWVISRVFQKTISSGAGGGSKKITAVGMSSSPASSVYLPPLLDYSPYAAASAAANDGDSCSYDGSTTTPKEHVSCFSTYSVSAASTPVINNINSNNMTNGSNSSLLSYDLAPPFDPFARFHSNNIGVSVFPSLRSLQDNLHLPFFFSPAAVSGGEFGGLVVPENHKVAVDGGATAAMPVCPLELDYMWGSY